MAGLEPFAEAITSQPSFPWYDPSLASRIPKVDNSRNLHNRFNPGRDIYHYYQYSEISPESRPVASSTLVA